MSEDKVDPLRLVLQHMEEQLDDRVEALSESKPSREESTADLIHLEETLSSAQDKAKKLVTLRLKLDEEAAETAHKAADQPAADRAAAHRASPGPHADARNDPDEGITDSVAPPSSRAPEGEPPDTARESPQR